MWDHANDDGEEGAGEGAEEELLAAGQAGVLDGVQAEEGHRDREEPEPLPEQGGGHKQLLHLQHEHVEPVQHLGGQLEDHHKQQEVVRENRPPQPYLVLYPGIEIIIGFDNETFLQKKTKQKHLHFPFCQNFVVCI